MPDDVLQLAHVARPVVSHAGAPSSPRRAAAGALVAEGIGVEELADEHGNLVGAIPQGGHADVHHAEAIVEILAEFAPLDEGPQLPVGRRHDPDVDSDFLVAAQPREGPVLEHVEQLGLERQRHLADLVQEDGAAVGLLEAAELPAFGAREGPALVAEQLALQQVARHRRAVDLDERPVPPRRRAVQRLGDHLLAHPRLAEDEGRHVGGTDQTHHPEDAGHRLQLPRRPAGRDRPLVALLDDAVGRQDLAVHQMSAPSWPMGPLPFIVIGRSEKVIRAG